MVIHFFAETEHLAKIKSGLVMMTFTRNLVFELLVCFCVHDVETRASHVASAIGLQVSGWFAPVWWSAGLHGIKKYHEISRNSTFVTKGLNDWVFMRYWGVFEVKHHS